MTPSARDLRMRLARVRRRWFVLTMLSTGGRASALAGLPLLAAAVLLRTTGLTGRAVAATVAAAALAGSVAVALVLFRMQRRPDDVQVARFIEERVPAASGAPLCDALVTAVQVVRWPDRHPPAFAGVIVENALRELRALPPSSVIPPATLRRATVVAAAGAAVLAGAILLAFPFLVQTGAAAWLAMFPRSVQIEVATGDVRVPAGRPLRIEAAVRGRAAALLGVQPRLVVSAGDQQRVVPMTARGGAFVYEFESVDRSFGYHVSAGAVSSTPHTVTALFPPRVTRIDIGYAYPRFTGLAPREDIGGGDVYGPAGTRVRVSVHTDKPLASGEMALESGGSIPLRPSGASAASAELVLARDDAYRLRITDADDLSSSGGLEYFIRVMEDRPPDVRVLRPAGDQGITPLEEVVIEARADDDYGVAALELVYSLAGRAPRVVPFRQTAGSEVQRTGTHVLAAEDLGVQPGDVITYYVRARDVARGKPASVSRSDMFFLEVKPFNEEFVSAQSQAMGGPPGTQIDGLIAAQKEIISATWNLERRSAAGRSAEDAKAVAQAQAELKERVERMLSGARRGRGALPPQQIAPGGPAGAQRGTEPIGAAVAAMERAVGELGRARTAEAIPHEMQALEGLLKAQAEVRRRQVLQQSASAAGQGGTSRTDRDLSALFDRELQRQQRTNYETPRESAAEREPESQSDALQRVRDLARRQEELAARQRELMASGLSAEEMKRALERLTREQQEIRAQAEALERELRTGSQAGRQGGRGQQPNPGEAGAAQAGASARRAADAMRNAAGEMERQNAAGAAAAGEAAARSLRELERRMTGATPEARQRAAGELQLEARQIAEAQRRIAGESARLQKDPQGAAVDAMRRLASEKDQLASRVDELQRTARELERQMPGGPGAALRDAARILETQQVAGEMRKSAERLRGGARDGTPPADAALEQRVSRALESVADTLGAGPGRADARGLTDELDRVRQMRDRLDALERQVRDAEARARQNGGRREPGAQPERDGRAAAGAGGSAAQDLERARDAYRQELQRTRETLGRLQSPPRDGRAGATPEHHEYSRSSPGTEAFKQDFGGWAELRQDVDDRLERYESAVAARAGRRALDDRLSAGGSDRVPDAYKERVSKYFEAIARGGK